MPKTTIKKGPDAALLHTQHLGIGRACVQCRKSVSLQLYVTVVGLELNHTDMDCFEHYLQEKEIFSINSIVFIITSRSPGHRKGFIGF